MNENDQRRLESHLKRTFNHGGIKLKPRKTADSVEVYVDDEFIGLVFEDEDGDGVLGEGQGGGEIECP